MSGEKVDTSLVGIVHGGITQALLTAPPGRSATPRELAHTIVCVGLTVVPVEMRANLLLASLPLAEPDEEKAIEAVRKIYAISRRVEEARGAELLGGAKEKR